MSFSCCPLQSVLAVTGSLDDDGVPSFFSSSSTFFSSKFRGSTGDLGAVISSSPFGLEEGGEGDKFKDRDGVGELRAVGETGGVVWGVFKSRMLFCSLSPTFCPSSLCVPFIRGGGDGLDKLVPTVSKVLCRFSS